MRGISINFPNLKTPFQDVVPRTATKFMPVGASFKFSTPGDGFPLWGAGVFLTPKTLTGEAPSIIRARKILGSGKSLEAEHLDLHVARAHYSGQLEAFPGVDFEDRQRAIFLATRWLGGGARAKWVVRRLDFAYAMYRRFHRDGADNRWLMEKLDVSDFAALVSTIKTQLEAVIRKIPDNDRSWQQCLKTLYEYWDLAESLQKNLSREQGMHYRGLMELAHGYIRDVGALRLERGVAVFSPGAGEYLMSQAEVALPGYLFTPQFEQVGLREYDWVLNELWAVGDHVLQLLEAFSRIFYDGLEVEASGDVVGNHDATHSRRDAVDRLEFIATSVRFETEPARALWCLSGMPEPLRAFYRKLVESLSPASGYAGKHRFHQGLLLKIALMESGLRWKESVRRIPDQAGRELAKMLWFVFHHETSLLDTRNFTAFHVFFGVAKQALRQGFRVFPEFLQKTAKPLEEYFFEQRNLHARILRPNDLIKLLSLPLSDYSMEAWIHGFRIIAQAYRLSEFEVEAEAEWLRPLGYLEI